MKFRIAHTTRYVYQGTVPIGYNRLCLMPRSFPGQERLLFDVQIAPVPAIFSRPATDYYGNEVTFFSVQEPHRTLEITAHSEVHVTPRTAPLGVPSPPWEAVRDLVRGAQDPALLDAYQFTFASECVPILESLRDYAAPSFAPGRPTIDAVFELMNRIYSEFAYDPTATTVATPVEEVLMKRRGVCQDFAHLQIGCLRAMGLPARYVSGYIAPYQADSGLSMVGAQASHAWLSVYVPGFDWVDFDPTNNIIPTNGHITLAWARDYQEVGPVRGVILGGGTQTLEVAVHVAAA